MVSAGAPLDTAWDGFETLRHFLNRSPAYIANLGEDEIHDLGELVWFEEAVFLANPDTFKLYQTLSFVGRLLALKKVQAEATRHLIEGDPNPPERDPHWHNMFDVEPGTPYVSELAQTVAPISLEGVIAGRNQEIAEKVERAKVLIKTLGGERSAIERMTEDDDRLQDAGARAPGRHAVATDSDQPGNTDRRPNRHDRRRLQRVRNRGR